MRTILVALLLALTGCVNASPPVPVCAGDPVAVCEDEGCYPACWDAETLDLVWVATCDADGVPCGEFVGTVAVCDCAE